MSGIILSGKCEKVVNKGGGFPTKTVREEIKNAFGIARQVHHHYMSVKKMKGTDYIIFNCPGCGKRNRQSAYRVKGSAGNALAIKCNGCCREIELARPPVVPTTDIIVAPTSPKLPSGLVDPSGRPIFGR